MLKMLYRLLALPLAALAVGLCALTSCQEQFTTDPGVRLGFSADTLRFDTVFSTIKSPTWRVMVYNPQRKAVRIDRVVLAGGEQSYFQVNVDGQAGHTVNDVEISAGDSAYVFVSVNVQRLGSDSALLVEDQLAFHFNGTTQQVVLQAYGQDVEIWHGRTILNDTTLTAAKPYLIYDSLAIAPGKLLTLEPGCRLYFHNNANLFVYGNLHAVGTAERPILMRGDRFDAMNYVPPVPYNDVAGQWGGVYLYGAGEHRMEHVSINSGSVGVFLTYAGRNGIPADESGNGGGYVFDCRSTHNPGRYEPYKKLTGLDEPVIRFLEDDGEILVFLESVYKLADAHVRRYMQRGFTDLMFCFGCTGGQHRSVYSAQHLAEHINGKFGVEVRIVHREQGISTVLEARSKGKEGPQP